MQSWNWRPLNQRYTYKDADGRELYQVVRIKRPDGTKTFYRCHHDENGNEVKGWDGLQQVPYRLETFRENNTGGFIFCEGEKDVDRLVSLGLPATGVAGGANGISPLLKKQPMFFNDYFSSFKGAIVIPDNDDPGREYANQVSSELSKLGIDVVQSMLPGLPHGGDVSDWLDANPGATPNQLLDALDQNAVEWDEPEPEPSKIPFSIDVEQELKGVERGGGENKIEDTFLDIAQACQNKKFVSDNQFNGLCPAHDDRQASLTVTLDKDNILMRCHAGCSFSSIVSAFGIKQSQTFRHRRAELEYRQAQQLPGPSADEIKELAKSLLEKSEPEEFNHSLLPPIIQEYVADAAELTTASPIIILSTLLASIGAGAGRNLSVQDPDYYVALYPNLWALSIMGSGSYKSTALNIGARCLLDDEKFVMGKVKDEEDRIRTLRDAGTDLEDDELQQCLKDVEFFQEQRKILPAKSTWEACINRIDQTGGGLWLLSEFGGWLAGLESKHNNSSGFKHAITEIYDVPDFYEHSTVGRGSRILRNPFVGIAGVSTLPFLEGLLSKDDAATGFLARFMLFRPPEKKEIPEALPNPDQAKMRDKPAYGLVYEILENLKLMTVPLQYTLTPKAKQIFTEFHNGIFKRLHDSPDVLKEVIDPFCKRWSPGAIKVAMINQYLLDSKSTQIGEHAMAGAISVINYAEKSTRFLFSNNLGTSAHHQKQQKILDYLARRGGTTTRGKLHASKILGGGAKDYDYVLESLETACEIAMERSEGKLTPGTKIMLSSGGSK